MTLSIDLPEETLARLLAEAGRRGVSIEAVIAELADQLPAEVSSGSKRRRSLSFVGTLSAEPDLAERAEDILDELARRHAG